VSKRCLAHQVNTRTADFFCTKDAGHAGGHTDPTTKKVWGTPKLPYGMWKKWARKKYN